MSLNSEQIVGKKIWLTVPAEVVIAYVAAEAAKVGFIEKVILFGSRANGSARPFSDYDYDFAVELTPDTPRIEWLGFAERLDDEAPTLCQLSLIQLRPSVRPELRERIAKEGIVVYQRPLRPTSPSRRS